MESNLEQLVDKSVKVRDSLSRTLIKNFPIEKDFADFLAMDVVNQAIGVDALERYNNARQLEKEKQDQKLIEQARLARIQGYKNNAKSTLKYIGASIPVLILVCLLGWGVVGMYACATASPYPRTYTPLPEHARFSDTERSSWRGDQIHGLSDETNLCLSRFQTVSRGIQAAAPTCINPKKAESLNIAMTQAVESDFNGVIWEGPNGTGEIWTVTRNNYRFVITAKKDESFLTD